MVPSSSHPFWISRRRLWRRWAVYSLRRKLLLAFGLVTLVAVGTVSLFSLFVLRTQLAADVERSLTQLAASHGQAVGDILARRVDTLQALTVNRVLPARLEQVNELDGQGNTAVRLERWRHLDALKLENPDDSTVVSATDSILRNDVSDELLRFRNLFPENQHIIVTNALGGLVGSTDSNTKFYVGDQDWWQAAYRDGRGNVFIGHTPDQSGLIIAVPIYGRDSQVVVGILQANLPLTIFEPVLSNSATRGQLEQSILAFPTGDLYFPVPGNTAVVTASDWLLDGEAIRAGNISLASESVVAGLAPVNTADPGTRITVDGLDWQVITYLPEDVALAPVNATLQTFVPAILVALVLSGLLVVPMAPLLTRPITNLTTAVRHAARGHWGETVDVETEDEIGELTATYNRLSLKLAETMEDLHQRNEMLETSAQVARAASASLDLDKVLRTTVERISTQFGFYFVAVFLVDDLPQSTTTAVLYEASGTIGEFLKTQPYSFTTGSPLPVGRVLKNRQPHIMTNMQDIPHYADERQGQLQQTQAEAAVPLMVGSMLLGVLDVHSKEPNPFNQDITSLLTTLADQIAIAIQHARLYGDQIRTAEKLAEADRLKSEFLATMSHELRTPLNSIIGFSKLMLNGLDGELSEQQTEDLEVIHRNGLHLLHIINQILDFSKLGAGKLDLVIEPLDLQPLMLEAEQSLRGLLDGKRIRVTVHIPTGDRPFLMGDRVRLRQMLFNLVSNAAKFTEEGYIGMELTYTPNTAVIEVHDTGIGIPPDRLDIIFQEFTQVDSSNTRAFGGTGLGLPITKKFVELHGGQINVQSIYGRGSTFRVELPLTLTSPPHINHVLPTNALTQQQISS